MKKIQNELYRRLLLNRKRLGDELYRYPTVLTQTDSWPGDFPGRAILALTSLYNAFSGYNDIQEDILNQVNEIINHLDEVTNEYGYFGLPFNSEFVDEQQVSGNSWFIRGLVSYYNITKDEKCLDRIKSIVKNFLIPISEFYPSYPVSKREFGGVSGHLTEELYNGWKLSSDIGCAFIMMDGMSDAYHVTHDLQLKEVLELVIEKFLSIDFITLECQTHATLSCTRGIYRFYLETKDEKYLKNAINIFDLYVENGMTLDYANMNWFNRPTTWTEPCCIVDSLILAKKLYLETKNEKYLRLFNKIYENSLRTFQRDNGGAGCSTIAINDQYSLKMFMYEAFFCCTMRLGEGLEQICDFSSFIEDENLIIPYVVSVNYQDNNNEIFIDNTIYQNNRILIKTEQISNISKIKIYLPKGQFINDDYHLTNEHWLLLDLKENSEIIIEYKLDVHENEGLHFLGDMLLSIKGEKVKGEIEIDGQLYSPLYDNSLYNEEQLANQIQYLRK